MSDGSGDDEGSRDGGKTGGTAWSGIKSVLTLCSRSSMQGLASVPAWLLSGVGGLNRPLLLAAALDRGHFAGGDPAGGNDLPKSVWVTGTLFVAAVASTDVVGALDLAVCPLSTRNCLLLLSHIAVWGLPNHQQYLALLLLSF